MAEREERDIQEEHRRAVNGGNTARRRKKQRARTGRKLHPLVKEAKEIEDMVFKYHNRAMEAEALQSDLFRLAREASNADLFCKKKAEKNESLYFDSRFRRLVNELEALVPILLEASEDAAARATKYHQLAMDTATLPVLRLYYNAKHDLKKLGKSEKWERFKNIAPIVEDLEPEEPEEEKHKVEEQHCEEEKEEEKQQLKEKEDEGAALSGFHPSPQLHSPYQILCVYNLRGRFNRAIVYNADCYEFRYQEPEEEKYNEEEQHCEEEKEEEKQHLEEKEGDRAEPEEEKKEEVEEEKELVEEKHLEEEDGQVMGCCGGFWRWVRSWGRRNRGRV